MRRLLTPQFQKHFLTSGPYQIGDIGTQTIPVRAGRALNDADFSNYGMDAATKILPLTSLNDVNGVGTLTNGGAVTFTGDSVDAGPGGSAAVFNGSTTSHLTAANTLKQAYGTWGVWFKTCLPTPSQYLLTMVQSATQFAFQMLIGSGNGKITVQFTNDGQAGNLWQITGDTYVIDDRWHFVCFTWDGNQSKIYLDGRLDSLPTPVTGGGGGTGTGPLFLPSTALFYIGGREQDTSLRFFGTMNHAFIHPDVLNEKQIRYLYCAKVTLPTANFNRVKAKVYQYSRNKNFVSGDFPTQPLVGYNFQNVSTTDNYGSLGKTLTANNTPTAAPGLDGQAADATFCDVETSEYFSATDTSLPSGTSVRSVGLWVKPALRGNPPGGNGAFVAYGSTTSPNGFALYYNVASGNVVFGDPGTNLVTVNGSVFSAAWTFITLVLSATSPVKRIYVNGSLAQTSTTALSSTTLVGANAFRINLDNNSSMLDSQSVYGTLFICNYELSSMRLLQLYNKQGTLYNTHYTTDITESIVAVDSKYMYIDLANFLGNDSIEFIFS